MILPEIFILLGICMLLLMSLSERSQPDASSNSIFKAQINAINIWFESGVSHKVDSNTYPQKFPGSQRTRRRQKGRKEHIAAMDIASK